jgi:beta-glucosidase
MSPVSFPHDFVWGAATASYQLEGGVAADGRGETIWDRFSHTPGAIRTGEVGDVACDHHRLFSQDVAMIGEMGHRGYRFSVAWSRVFPEGRGKVNPRGLDFYNALVDALLEKGILPFVTLYHWDLPQAIQDRGGWGNRDTADYYAEYAAAMFQALGDRVKNWITHNEPWCTAYLGYAEGIHAPGLKDFGLAVNATHTLLLSHAKAVARFREVSRGGRIGITLNLWPMYAASDSPRDAAAARAADGHYNRWFLDPVFKGAYPEDTLEQFRANGFAPRIAPGDLDLLAKGRMDFLGVNYYMRHIIAHSDTARFGFESRKPEKAQLTEMGWEVFPEGLYDLLARLDRDYGRPELYVTENGIACRDDRRFDGRVEDDDRIAYLRDHFFQAHRAIKSGVKLRGYFVWTLMDCFEWNDGFSMKFGLASVDQKTLERKLKKSALWFRDMIRADGFSAD